MENVHRLSFRGVRSSERKWGISLRISLAILWYTSYKAFKGKTMTEIFKDISGYEGSYQVSNLGNVKSLPKSDGNGNKERLLKQELVKGSATAYHRVTLSKNGSTKRFQTHRLVAQTFIPNPYNKPIVNHIDNNGQNNCVTNLEWCSASENMKHSAKQGRQDLPRKLGGVAAAQVRQHTYDMHNKSLVGTTIGQLTIIGYYRDDTLTKTSSAKFICVCSCGNKIERLKYNLFSKTRPQMCNECSFKLRKDKDIVNTM